MDVYTARVQEVQSWQTRYHMTPRRDSRLTEKYARGELDACWTADVVARELCCTDFIFKQTLYGEMIEVFLRQVAARVHRDYRISWTQTWNIVQFYGPIALKILCLERCGIAMPQLTPSDANESSNPTS